MYAFAQAASPDAPHTVAQAVKIDPSLVLTTVEKWVVGFQKLLPNIFVAICIFALFVLGAWAAHRAVNGWARRRNRANLGEVLGSFVRWIVLLFGVSVALTIVVPSLNPGDLVAGLGIGSVAIGFAFKDILQNWLAGLLLLMGEPFRPNDQIVVSGHEGTVLRIETRATILKTYDGRNVIVPNSDVYSHAVLVNTAHPKRRTDYDVGIGYGDSIDHAREVILKALDGLNELEKDPAPEVLVWDLASSTVNLRVRWWTDSYRTNVVHARAEVLEAIKKALDAAGIDMPFDTQVLLFHDQSEDTDGKRGQQREGWPRKPTGENPQPAAVRLQRQASPARARNANEVAS